jgi:hypothetical protein
MIISVLMVVVGFAMILIDKPKKEVEEEKDIADMTYDEFSLYILNNDLTPYISRYVPAGDDFEIYYLQGRYFYRGYDKWRDAYNFYELIQIAHLLYTDDCNLMRGVALSSMFECDCCGEAEENHGVSYCWFKKAGESDADTI